MRLREAAIQVYKEKAAEREEQAKLKAAEEAKKREDAISRAMAALKVWISKDVPRGQPLSYDVEVETVFAYGDGTTMDSRGEYSRIGTRVRFKVDGLYLIMEEGGIGRWSVYYDNGLMTDPISIRGMEELGEVLLDEQEKYRQAGQEAIHG
jgi:hypothetical protein